jgi:hypothetical protein
MLAGCGRGNIQEYQVAKEPAPAQMPAMPPGHPDTSAPGVSKVEYKLPAGWQEAPLGPMRVASFRVAGKEGKQADVSVVPLPGLAGSDLANVNRWRGQVGLAGVSEEELGKLAQAVEIAGQPAKLYEQAGTNAASGEQTCILAAITRREGVAWFFKMTGDDALVAEQKPVFVEFLKSVSFPAAGVQAQLPPAHPPIDVGSMMAQAGAAASSGQAKPTWEVPSGWKEIPGGPFLVAKFALSGAGNAQAVVNVSMSSGDGGGFLANVNRWRGQLGLEPTTETQLAKESRELPSAGDKTRVAEITGKDGKTGQPARLVAVVVPRSGETWFYKLMGDPGVVQREQEAFLKFVQDVKY